MTWKGRLRVSTKGRRVRATVSSVTLLAPPLPASLASADVRWKQRWENLRSAVSGLEQGVKFAEPDLLRKAGIIHFFETRWRRIPP